MVKIIKLIFGIFSWLRFFLAVFLMYLFCYEYLYKKYEVRIKEYDSFFTKKNSKNGQSIEKVFEFSQRTIYGERFSCNLTDPNESCQYNMEQLSQFVNKQKAEQQYAIQDHSSNQEKPIQKFLSIQEVSQTIENIIQNPIEKLQKIFTSLPIHKSVHSYLFDFYNWYRFQFIFTDIGFQSYLQFRIAQQNQGSHSIKQKISFKLPQNFYPQFPSDNKNQLKINFVTSGLQLNVTQTTLPQLYGDQQCDGLAVQKFYHLSQNRTMDQQEYKKFGSQKTLTTFNFKLIRKNCQIRANISHVIRHNQCFNSMSNGVLRHKCMGGYGKGKLNYYYFVKKNVEGLNNQYQGDWHRQIFNLDNSRARTIFIGQRSTNMYFKPYLSHINFNSIKNALQIQQVNNMIDKLTTFNSTQVQNLVTSSIAQIMSPPAFNHRTIQMDFIGFNKQQYYSKHQNIQKQRWVGMTLSTSISQTGQPIKNKFIQNFLFVNGNVHPIYQIDFGFLLTNFNMMKYNKLKFRHSDSQNIERELKQSKRTPEFQIQFLVLNTSFVESQQMFDRKKVYRIDGFWSGWINESTLNERNILDENVVMQGTNQSNQNPIKPNSQNQNLMYKQQYLLQAQQQQTNSQFNDKISQSNTQIPNLQFVSFYNITGTIKITQEMY